MSHFSVRTLLVMPPAAIVAGLLVAPVLYLLRLSFFKAVPGRMDVIPGVTLFNFDKLLFDTFYLGVLFNTLWLSCLITLLTLVLGYLLAYFLWRVSRRWKMILTFLVVAPMMIGIVVRAYGWMILLGDAGVVNGFLKGIGLIDQPLHMMFSDGAIVIGLTHVQLPFMVLSILAALDRVDHAMAEAAETLGADRLRTVWHVILPLSFPGVVAGCTLVFTLNMTAFATPVLLGGNGTRVMTVLIYQQFSQVFNWPFGAASAVVLLGLTFLVLFVFLRMVMRRAAAWMEARPEGNAS